MSADVTSNLEELPERVAGIEQKLENLEQAIDRRFDEVSQAFVEQREYTEFAFNTLRNEMNVRFDAVDKRFDAMDKRFDAMDKRFDDVMSLLRAWGPRRRTRRKR